MRIRFLLILGVVGIVGGVSILMAIAGGAVVRDRIVDHMRQALAREISLVAHGIEGGELTTPDSLVRALTSRIDHRVTFIEPSGAVLADSDVPPGRMSEVEDHGDRPEVVGALQGDTVAYATRASATVGRSLVYAARSVDTARGPIIVRLAASPDAVEEAVSDFRRRIGWSGLGVGVVGVFLALGFSARLEEPLTALAQRSRALAEGETDLPEPPVSRIAEIENLAVAFSRSSVELRARLRELSRERDRMQILIDSMAEGVLALTDDARILRTNDAARELLELPETLRFAPVGSVVRHPDLRDLLESAVARSFQSREVTLGDRNLIVQSRLLSGGGAVVTLLDVTELRRLEQVRRDFVANASHELKTPLTSVRGFAETLLEDDPPVEIRLQFLRSIRDNTVRLQRLVDDLLDLSRLESGGWVARPQEVAVASTTRDAWKSMEDRAEAKSLSFEIHGDAEVQADPAGLSDVLRNLLENSVQYTPEGGSVRVDVRPRGETVDIEVTDTGIGVPSASLPRIFERFYRADPARSREAGGTGLGLAIVKHLVEAMDGDVTASSRLGRGTTIRISLPRAGA
ncbi:MAG: ATP-binding protein [Longimicrobiales bacterium]|nr:ATP-binding protein [Longimicrobiales bacterium]